MFYTIMNVICISHSQRVKDINYSQPEILGATVDVFILIMSCVEKKKSKQGSIPSVGTRFFSF